MDQVTAAGGTITLIHFVFQTEPERIACMPNMVEFSATPHHPNYPRTNEVRAVSCPACRKSEAFASAQRSLQDGLKRPVHARPQLG